MTMAAPAKLSRDHRDQQLKGGKAVGGCGSQQGRVKICLLLILILTLCLYYTQFLLWRPRLRFPPKGQHSHQGSWTKVPNTFQALNNNKSVKVNATISSLVEAPQPFDASLAPFGGIFRRENYLWGLPAKTLSFPSVLVNFGSGLGNQLFNYACGYAIARKHSIPLYLRIHSRKKRRTFDPDQRPFSLDLLSIPLFDGNAVDSSWDLTRSEFTRLSDIDMLSQSYVLSQTKGLVPGGYCQSEVFFAPFKQEILQLFVPNISNPEAVNPVRVSIWTRRIESFGESVAVHFRRGDAPTLNRIPVTFQIRAMTQIKSMLKQRPGSKQPAFFLFTDDPDGIRKELASINFTLSEDRCFFVSDNDSKMLEDFYLMSLCKHNIIPASSYAWWAAYMNLNINKIVIAAHHNHRHFADRPHALWQWRSMYYPVNWIVDDPLINVSTTTTPRPSTATPRPSTTTLRPYTATPRPNSTTSRPNATTSLPSTTTPGPNTTTTAISTPTTIRSA